MYLGFWRLNALEPLPLLGIDLKCPSEVSKSGLISSSWALAATADDPSAHSRVERLSAAVLSVLILHYSEESVATENRRLKTALPPCAKLIERYEALTKKYPGNTALWRETNWECYPALLDLMRTRMNGK